MSIERIPGSLGRAWWEAMAARYPFHAYLSPAKDVRRLIDDKVEAHTPFVSVRCVDEGRLYGFETKEARDRIAAEYEMEVLL
jgi:hypothetical protein